MSKVVKLKLKDIENIVKRINESTEEESEQTEQSETSADLPIAIGKGEDGKVYVFDTKTKEILGSL